MAEATFRVGDREYEVPVPNIGELRAIKRIYGVTDLSSSDDLDFDRVAALLFIAIRRAESEADEAEIVARIDSFDLSALTFSQGETSDDEADPTPPEQRDADALGG